MINFPLSLSCSQFVGDYIYYFLDSSPTTGHFFYAWITEGEVIREAVIAVCVCGVGGQKTADNSSVKYADGNESSMTREEVERRSSRPQ